MNCLSGINCTNSAAVEVLEAFDVTELLELDKPLSCCFVVDDMFDCGATGFTESVCFVALSRFDAFLAVPLFAKKDVL